MIKGREFLQLANASSREARIGRGWPSFYEPRGPPRSATNINEVPARCLGILKSLALTGFRYRLLRLLGPSCSPRWALLASLRVILFFT